MKIGPYQSQFSICCYFNAATLRGNPFKSVCKAQIHTS